MEIPSSAPFGPLSRANCFCFDLCTPEAASSFVHQTRGVVIRSRGSRWLSYLSAVYGGRAPLPFQLWRVNLFYENTHAWRRLWPAAVSPFRDCSMRRAQQHECTNQICKAWRAELNGVPGRGHHGRKGANGTADTGIALFHAQRRIHEDGVDTLEWAAATAKGEPLRSVQVFTRRSEALGRRLYRTNQWVEVVRSDHRPLGFQEGMLPPNCSGAVSLFRRARSAGGVASLFWRARNADSPRLPSCDWSAHPPGCFMRPVVGSGVWVNTGRTRAAASLRLPAGIRNPVAIEVLKAVRDGVDTLQYAWGDAVHQGRDQFTWPPLLVSTSPECVGRQQGVRACLPSEMRGGWHDSACMCDDALGVINCAGRAPPPPPARAPPQPSLKPRSRRNGPRAAASEIRSSPVWRQRHKTPDPSTAHASLAGKQHELNSSCRNCRGGLAAWSVGAPLEPGMWWKNRGVARTTVSHGPYPAFLTPVGKRDGWVSQVLATGGSVIQRIRRYLAAVYPAGQFSDSALVSDEAAVAFFVTRVWYYETDHAPSLPLDALTSRIAKCEDEHGCRGAVRCVQARRPSTRYHGALQLNERLTYRDIVPCAWRECTSRLARYSPEWALDIEKRGSDVFVEVWHWSYAGYLAGLDGGRWPSWDRGSKMKAGVRAPKNWADFLDAQFSERGGSGWWHMFAPGSGIFYHAGVTIVAPTKTAMLSRLLEKWLDLSDATRTAEGTLQADLRSATGDEPSHFLTALRQVAAGVQTCAEAGIPASAEACYNGGASFTLRDKFDIIMLRLGRALHYDSLFFSASFVRPQLDHKNYGAAGEIVDLRLAAPGPTFQSSVAGRAAVEVAEAQRLGRFSLRDPLHPGDASRALPCNFSSSRTVRLACLGHASWAVRARVPEDRWDCQIPV